MALPAAIALRIVTPDRLLTHESVDEVEIPGLEGYFGVLPGHTPLLAAIQPGALWYRKGQEKRYLFVGPGLAEVLPDQVTILAEVGERAEDIDVQRADERRREAEAHLGKPPVEIDFERARISMMKQIVRLQVAEKAKMRR